MSEAAHTPSGFCPHCGYPIDPGRCPECGIEVTAERLDTLAGRSRRRRRRRRVILLVLLALLLGGGAAAYRYVDWIAVLPADLLILRDRIRFDPDDYQERALVYDELSRRNLNGAVTSAQIERYFRGRMRFEVVIPEKQPDPECFVVLGAVQQPKFYGHDGSGPRLPPRLQWGQGQVHVDGREIQEVSSPVPTFIRAYGFSHLSPGKHEISITQSITVQVMPDSGWLGVARWRALGLVSPEMTFTASKIVEVEDTSSPRVGTSR